MNKKDIIQFFNTLPNYNSQEFSLKITQEILTSSTDVETLVNLLKEVLDEYKNKDNEIINNKKLAFAACYALIVLYRRYDEQFKIKNLQMISIVYLKIFLYLLVKKVEFVLKLVIIMI